MHVHAAGEQFAIAKGPVTTTQLVMYAGASGDFNRIHYDLPFAQEAGLGGVIAHGMLTMGFAAQLLTGWGGAGCFVQAIDARFLSPVRPGDTVHLQGAVTSISQTNGGRSVAVEFSGKVADREVIAGSGLVTFPA
jgi:acyl dehydratase